MAIKVFLLGRPGAGKSTAARYIHIFSKKHDWSTIHINDYPFLLELFKADTEYQRFKPAQYGGFDVIDFSVLNTVLHTVELEAEKYDAQEQSIVLMEFARDDYQQALNQFSTDFLQDAHFLFLTTHIDTCVKRVYQRTQNPTFHDDHFISEEMIRSYYHTDFSIQTYLHLDEYGIDRRNIHIIDNSGPRTAFYQQLAACILPLIYEKSMERIGAIEPKARSSASHPHIANIQAIMRHYASIMQGHIQSDNRHGLVPTGQPLHEIKLHTNLTDMLQ